jgi:hypothetical protein
MSVETAKSAIAGSEIQGIDQSSIEWHNSQSVLFPQKETVEREEIYR